MDRYSKFILTVIAVLLALHLVKPLWEPKTAQAGPAVQDVNIAQIGGNRVGAFAPALPVEIKNLRPVPVRVE